MLAVERTAPGFWPGFIDALDRALAGLDVTVTSWWREAAHNADVGGAAQSQHLIGTAVDIDGPDWPAAMERLRAAGFIVLRHAVAGGRYHVHAQAWPAGIAMRSGLLG